MKKLLLLFILSFPFFCVAQTSLKFSEVIESDEVSSDILYSRANIWFVDVFKDADKVIQLKDKENGIIKASPIVIYNGADDYYSGRIEYSITLEFRDGRFRYTFENFTHSGRNINIGNITTHDEAQFRAMGSSKARRNAEWNNIKTVINDEVKFLINGLEKHVSIDNNENDDW